MKQYQDTSLTYVLMFFMGQHPVYRFFFHILAKNYPQIGIKLHSFLATSIWALRTWDKGPLPIVQVIDITTKKYFSV